MIGRPAFVKSIQDDSSNRMKKTVSIPAGTRQHIFRRFSSSLSQHYEIEVAPAQDGGPISGTVEVQGSNWIFVKPIEKLPLSEKVVVHAGYWDTIFNVWVIPDQDVEVTMQKVRKPMPVLLIILAAVVIAAAVALVLISG